MFSSIITSAAGSLTLADTLICTLASLALGFVVSLVYMSFTSYSRNFVITLVVLPALVQMVIMMVNGNLGTSVAVVGTFSLVRFRSVPGSSREISSIFLAMAIGLATGTGYITFAVLFTVIVSAVLVLLYKLRFGERKASEKQLKITIPENLDYTDVFQDLFDSYTKKVSLEKVKTVNLGSMYELDYLVSLDDPAREKEFIDEIRCRNGNLTVICCKPRMINDEL